SWVFKKDITAFIAAGGASLMVLGLALRDMVLAAFTGIVLNVEKPFKPGDLVRLADKFQGRVERITWRVTVIQTATNELVHV
uniref:mechanosensitive ion channel domain-containing protein n=2 Tax=Gammaproteobacteria TaxID=1236 RepID=UPI0013D36BA1